MPIAALVVLVGGFVVVVGAVLLFQSGAMSGPAATATPAPVEQAGQPVPVASPDDAGAQAAADPSASRGGETAATAQSASVPATPAQVAGAATTAPPAAPPGDRPTPVVEAAKSAEPAPAPKPEPPPFRKTFECREYATFKIDPDTTIVTVDGEVIGIADEWADTPRTKKYKFEKEGVHYVKLSHRDYETLWLRFIVSKDALDKTAIVELEMKKNKDDQDK